MKISRRGRTSRCPRCGKRWRITQAGYIQSLFAGAKGNWGQEYFERRLHVGLVHDRINLPFKWYIGSYVEMERLLRQQLENDFEDANFVKSASASISKVLNYDMQAVGDSFLLKHARLDAVERGGDPDQPRR